MLGIICPHCGSDKIGICRTTRYIYLPEVFKSIKKNCAVVEERTEGLGFEEGIDSCSFFCNNCLEHIEKEEFDVKTFRINGYKFF